MWKEKLFIWPLILNESIFRLFFPFNQLFFRCWFQIWSQFLAVALSFSVIWLWNSQWFPIGKNSIAHSRHTQRDHTSFKNKRDTILTQGGLGWWGGGGVSLRNRATYINKKMWKIIRKISVKWLDTVFPHMWLMGTSKPNNSKIRSTD